MSVRTWLMLPPSRDRSPHAREGLMIPWTVTRATELLAQVREGDGQARVPDPEEGARRVGGAEWDACFVTEPAWSLEYSGELRARVIDLPSSSRPGTEVRAVPVSGLGLAWRYDSDRGLLWSEGFNDGWLLSLAFPAARSPERLRQLIEDGAYYEPRVLYGLLTVDPSGPGSAEDVVQQALIDRFPGGLPNEALEPMLASHYRPLRELAITWLSGRTHPMTDRTMPSKGRAR